MAHSTPASLSFPRPLPATPREGTLVSIVFVLGTRAEGKGCLGTISSLCRRVKRVRSCNLDQGESAKTNPTCKKSVDLEMLVAIVTRKKRHNMPTVTKERKLPLPLRRCVLARTPPPPAPVDKLGR